MIVVVLDVDDTLYLERDFVRSGFDAVGSWARDRLGVGGVGDQAWALFESGVRRTTVTEALAHCGVVVTPELISTAVRIYRTHDPDIAVSADAQDFLQLRRADFLWAVVTDGPPESQRAKCSALGLFDFANPVVITSEHGSSKPDPEMFRVVEKAHRRTGDKLIYVADNPAKDFQGPLSLGWRCVRVRRAGALHEQVETPRGIPEVSDFSGLALHLD